MVSCCGGCKLRSRHCKWSLSRRLHHVVSDAESINVVTVYTHLPCTRVLKEGVVLVVGVEAHLLSCEMGGGAILRM